MPENEFMPIDQIMKIIDGNFGVIGPGGDYNCTTRCLEKTCNGKVLLIHAILHDA